MSGTAVRRWRRRPRVVGLTGFLLLFGMFTLWSLASPLASVPDEPAHLARAVSAARGQFLGKALPNPGGAYTEVRVPAGIDKALPATRWTACPLGGAHAIRPLRPCTNERGEFRVATYVGRYPLLFYLLTGPVSLFVHGKAAIYLMRIVGGAVCAAMLALGFAVAATSTRAPLLALGLATAITPTVLFLAGSVNPSGLEICAAAGLWASGVVLFGEPDPVPRRWPVVVVTIQAAVLVSMRGLSPVMLAVIGLCLIALAGRRRITELLRRRVVRTGLIVVLGISVLAVAWIFAAGTLNLAPVGVHVGKSQSTASVFGVAVRVAWQQLPGTIGLFDLNKIVAPLAAIICVAIVALTLLAGALVAGALTMRRRADLRFAAVLFVLAALTLLLPAALATLKAHTDGLVEQARYIMPIAVGIPIVAAYSLTRVRRIAQYGALLGGGLLAAAQVICFLLVLERFRVGISVSARHPPGGVLALEILFVLLAIGYAAFVSLASPETPTPTVAMPAATAQLNRR